MNVYRMTDKKLIDEILDNGIKMRGNWYDLGPAVYVTKKFSTADKYRDYVEVDDPAIVKIAIPDEIDPAIIVHDDGDEEHYGITDSYRIEMDIPASWIIGAWIYDGSMDEWTEVE